MEKAMAPHSSTLARKIPWMEEPGHHAHRAGAQVRGGRGRRAGSFARGVAILGRRG